MIPILDLTKQYEQIQAEVEKTVLEVLKSGQYICGKHNKALQEEIIKCGLENNFEFTGYVDNVYSQLSRFDIFAYLLNPYHFGATENALLEAMAYELPVIALNQSVEKHIIKPNAPSTIPAIANPLLFFLTTEIIPSTTASTPKMILRSKNIVNETNKLIIPKISAAIPMNSPPYLMKE